MEYFIVECYCTCILREFKIFFHPAKFDNFKDEKISDFKTVSVSQRKNLLDWKLVVLWDYEQLLRGVFLCFGGQKEFKKKNILANALKSYKKWLLYIYFFFLKNFEKVEKNGIISTKFSLRCTPSVILGTDL